MSTQRSCTTYIYQSAQQGEQGYVPLLFSEYRQQGQCLWQQGQFCDRRNRQCCDNMDSWNCMISCHSTVPSGDASCPRMSVDILGTSWDQCMSMVQYCYTSTETTRLVRTISPGRPSRLSHSSWTMTVLLLGSWSLTWTGFGKRRIRKHHSSSLFFFFFSPLFCCCRFYFKFIFYHKGADPADHPPILLPSFRTPQT